MESCFQVNFYKTIRTFLTCFMPICSAYSTYENPEKTWICSIPSQPASANVRFLKEINSQTTPVISLKILTAENNKDFTPDNYNFSTNPGAVTQGTEIDEIMKRTIDVGLISPQDILNKLPNSSLLKDLCKPGCFNNILDIEKSWNEQGNLIKNNLLRKFGIKILGNPLYHGNRYLYLTDIKNSSLNLERLKQYSLKFRVPSSHIWAEIADYYGATKVLEIKNPDLENALNQKEINAFEMPLPSLFSNGLDQYVSQMITTPHLVSVLFFAISNEKFNALKSDQQKGIEETINNCIRVHYTRQLEEEENCMQKIKAQGVIITK